MRLLLALAAFAFTLGFSPSAKAADCFVQYQLDNAGNITSSWVDLGSVSWPDRLDKCRDKVDDAAAAHVLPLLPTYAPIGSGNLDAICSRGFINVRSVIELRNTNTPRDTVESVRVPVSCQQDCSCPSDRWEETGGDGTWCVKGVCRGFEGLPMPANNTSFINQQGYFFWGGELRHRERAACDWTGINGAPYGDGNGGGGNGAGGSGGSNEIPVRWTEWFNRDLPTGNGDYETIDALVNAGMGCANPAAIQCRISARPGLPNGAPWNQTNDNYSCSLPRGGVCVNSQTDDGECEDYEIRLACPL